MRGCRRHGDVVTHCVERQVGDLAVWGRTVWKDKSETWRCEGALCGKTSRRLGDVGTHCVERQVGDLAMCETHCAFQLGELGRTV